MTTMTTRPATQPFERSPIADPTLKAARRERASPPPAAQPKTASTVSFNWQLEADGVQDAIERTYR
jgi:hypothetical protein